MIVESFETFRNNCFVNTRFTKVSIDHIKKPTRVNVDNFILANGEGELSNFSLSWLKKAFATMTICYNGVVKIKFLETVN